MKWINSQDLIRWSTVNPRDCQGKISYLVSRLIRATSVGLIKEIKFPTEDNIAIGGLDGYLEVSKGNYPIPDGISVWEFGTGKDPKGKADDDYEKRCKIHLVEDPSICTFVFVTPKEWKAGEDWAKEKSKDGFWKEVRVINAGILDEWIEQVPSVGAWLAKMFLVGKYPSEGIDATDYFWDRWSTGLGGLKILPELLLGGRENQAKELLQKTEKPSLVYIKDISREDSLAFVISCFKTNAVRNEDFFARSLIVDTPEVFYQLCTLEHPLILIPRFEDTGCFHYAVQKGHTVIVPVGADYTGNSDATTLPKIEREQFVKALEKMGFKKEIAEKHSKESSRNITILRRQLNFQKNTPQWATAENARDIIPALILGRWDERYPGDKAIIEKLSGDTYENYSKKLIKWLNTPDSPIVKIGTTWRLASPLDAWTYLARFMSEHDFQLLHESFIEIVSEKDPALDLPEDRRYMASFYGKTSEFSRLSKNGIIQSLILISIYGDILKINLNISSETWVDRIIETFLNNKDPLFWKSIEDALPLFAEASPKSFLNAIEALIDIENSPIKSLFDEEEGLMFTHAYHTGLLWALENIAWLAEFLSRTTLLIAKLVELDPGGRLANRPINTLSEIFKPWHCQTFASVEERLEALKLISKRHTNVAWVLLIRMLPDNHGIGQNTHKMRWRNFNQVLPNYFNIKEVQDTHTIVIELLLEIFDFSEKRLEQLIDETVLMIPSDRDKVFKFIHRSIDKIEQEEYTSWNRLRDLLDRHRSYPNTNWALSEEELKPYEELYNLLEPKDEIDKLKWMFDANSARFPDGFEYGKVSHEEQRQIMLERRIDALKHIYKNFSNDKVKALSKTVKEPRVLGDTFGFILEDESEIISLCEFLNNDLKDLQFIHYFILRKSLIHGFDWVYNLYEKLKVLGFQNSALAQLFIPLDQSAELWKFIDSTNKEIRDIYWRYVFPSFWNLPTDDKLLGLSTLMEFNRFYSTIQISSHFLSEIPSELLVKILQSLIFEKTHEQSRLMGYEINNMFEMLDKREDIDKKVMSDLEFLYLPMLASYGNPRKPKILHEKLSTEPDFFIEILTMTYPPDGDDELKLQEIEGVSEEEIQVRTQVGYELLNSWKQIPGLKEDGKIDEEFLKS